MPHQGIQRMAFVKMSMGIAEMKLGEQGARGSFFHLDLDKASPGLIPVTLM